MSQPPTPNPHGTEAVKAYLLANPSLPSRTIARHLFNDPKNRGLWSSMEAARSSVRSLRGANGEQNRERISVIAPPSPLCSEPLPIESSPFYCPPSDRVEWKPYVVSAATEDKTLILSDIHFPYHDEAAIRLAIAEGVRTGCSRVILNGDTIDMYQLSRFQKDPRLRNFAGEIEITKTFLESLREQFPDAEIIWKDGNHDERYQHYLQTNAPALIGVPEFRFEVLMGFFDLGIKYVTDKRPIQLGNNIIVHGHEFGIQIFSPVNPARGLFLKAKHNAACGHHHATSEHTARTLGGELIICYSTGCLCDLNPLYRPINDHNQGFAIQTTRPNGSFDFHNLRIEGGRIT